MTVSLTQTVSASSLIRFAFPTIISNIFMGLYSSVDGMFVSRLINTDALSAVNLVFPVIMTALAVGSMFGSGVNAIAAKKLGEGNPREARENISLIALLAFFLSTVFSLLCAAFLEPMIYFLGSDKTLFSYCRAYMIPIICFLPVCVLGMLFQMLFISIGKPDLGLLASLAGGISNMLLDYLLIAVADMGIAGAAIASSIGYSLPAGIGFFYFLFNRKNSLYLVLPRWDMHVIIKSCTNGISEMFSSTSAALVTFFFNRIMMKLAGPDGVAAVTIALYVYSILGSAAMGYSMGIAPMISFRFGMQDYNALKKIYRCSLKLLSLAALAVTALSQAAAGLLVLIFSDPGTPVYAMAVSGFRLFSLSFLTTGFAVFASSMFTALSDGRTSGLLSFLRNFVFTLLALLALPALLGIPGVWLAVPAAELLSAGMAFYYWNKKKEVYQYG